MNSISILYDKNKLTNIKPSRSENFVLQNDTTTSCDIHLMLVVSSYMYKHTIIGSRKCEVKIIVLTKILSNKQPNGMLLYTPYGKVKISSWYSDVHYFINMHINYNERCMNS